MRTLDSHFFLGTGIDNCYPLCLFRDALQSYDNEHIKRTISRDEGKKARASWAIGEGRMALGVAGLYGRRKPGLAGLWGEGG